MALRPDPGSRRASCRRARGPCRLPCRWQQPRPSAQAIIKVNDNVNIKFGLLLQPQAEFDRDAERDGTGTERLQPNRSSSGGPAS